MRLADYLADAELSYTEFARRCGTKHARTIERLAKDQCDPGPKMLKRIISASDGKVTANDFFPAPATALT